MLVLSILAAIGTMSIISKILESFWSIFYLISYHFWPAEDLRNKFGAWAVVTGCTDGIGKQYALELARRGLNVALISRNAGKLKEIAALIENDHGVRTKIIVADFTDGLKIYPQIDEELQNLEIGILVNNVGIFTDYPMPFCEYSPIIAWNQIQVNCGACTLLTRYVLPKMAARGRGAIINMSSGTALCPPAGMAVYSSTKAYIQAFTTTIRREYESKGIFIQNLKPFVIESKMSACSDLVKKKSILVVDAETYARHAVSTLGRVKDTTGYWGHGIQYFLSNCAPTFVLCKIVDHITENDYQENLQEKCKSN